MGGQAEDQVYADPGARTHIGARRNFLGFSKRLDTSPSHLTTKIDTKTNRNEGTCIWGHVRVSMELQINCCLIFPWPQRRKDKSKLLEDWKLINWQVHRF